MLYPVIQRGHRPNVLSHTTLIDGYCRIGDVNVAYMMFDETFEWGVYYNALTYTALIRGVLRKREFEKRKILIGNSWEVIGRTRAQSLAAIGF
ncbi:pentatricopeptide repeat-containing protein at3g18020 [Phtheirospermum japonicum]|uniref:Pentatricopeptide repeat-containing protein at3g18020 n=1 Tax=Phtheirospermum japonicum TaxID=374723 RepID=A0A830CY69_9LAMI|nr:pentatricopeptide repeat-containing protein at3g18020 [Phtheirospermum japonicum]